MIHKIIDLTSDVSKSCAFRGGALPTIQLNEISRTFNRASTISFSVHCTTHIDLPWSFDWEKLSTFYKSIKSQCNNSGMDSHQNKRFSDIISFFDDMGLNDKSIALKTKNMSLNRGKIKEKYSGWIEKKCIVLDFSDKIGVIEDFLDLSFPSLYLRDDIDKLEAHFLFDQLKITKKDIEKKLISIKETFGDKYPKDGLKDKIIVIKTLWSERFLPYKMDINNPIFEGWHAFLTYPYLARDAIIYLIDEEVAGVASDTISLENPLLYIDFLSDNYKKYLQQLEEIEIGISPLHLSFLSNQKLIIENLWYLNKIPSPIGTLYVFPYQLGTLDGTIANVFFETF